MVERNADAPLEDRIEFRIGINVGDIIADDGDIFGNGVNVAARLEAIADRGGICISRQALDQIEDKLELSFRELGRQNLKNISKPIEVYASGATEHPPFLPTQVLSKRSGIAVRPTGCAWPMRRLARGHLWYDLHIG
jgi:class 3 adenylate cyclase